jgi:hypothetical protein
MKRHFVSASVNGGIVTTTSREASGNPPLTRNSTVPPVTDPLQVKVCDSNAWAEPVNTANELTKIPADRRQRSLRGFAKPGRQQRLQLLLGVVENEVMASAGAPVAAFTSLCGS